MSEWDKLLLQPDPYNPLCVYASARLAVREDTDPAHLQPMPASPIVVILPHF